MGLPSPATPCSQSLSKPPGFLQDPISCCLFLSSSTERSQDAPVQLSPEPAPACPKIPLSFRQNHNPSLQPPHTSFHHRNLIQLVALAFSIWHRPSSFPLGHAALVTLCLEDSGLRSSWANHSSSGAQLRCHSHPKEGQGWDEFLRCLEDMNTVDLLRGLPCAFSLILRTVRTLG